MTERLSIWGRKPCAYVARRLAVDSAAGPKRRALGESVARGRARPLARQARSKATPVARAAPATGQESAFIAALRTAKLKRELKREPLAEDLAKFARPSPPLPSGFGKQRLSRPP